MAVAMKREREGRLGLGAYYGGTIGWLLLGSIPPCIGKEIPMKRTSELRRHKVLGLGVVPGLGLCRV